jgi:flavin-dependent dehydrogenase
MNRDVVVVGAGPAGSTVANLLARAGVDVLVLERERFPRFHVGESLLPRDLPLFERLGVDPLRDGFLRKRGAEFIDERTGQSTLFSFEEGLDGTPPYAFQVDRATFDQWLVQAAEREGAQVRCETTVSDVVIAPDRVEIVEAGGERHVARYVVDATGQDSFLARRNRSREPYRDFGKGAVFRRYVGLAPAVVEELCTHGDIKILVLGDGWVWIIPLAGPGSRPVRAWSRAARSPTSPTRTRRPTGPAGRASAMRRRSSTRCSPRGSPSRSWVPKGSPTDSRRRWRRAAKPSPT